VFRRQVLRAITRIALMLIVSLGGTNVRAHQLDRAPGSDVATCWLEPEPDVSGCSDEGTAGTADDSSCSCCENPALVSAGDGGILSPDQSRRSDIVGGHDLVVDGTRPRPPWN
jgi:hypothetical protein